MPNRDELSALLEVELVQSPLLELGTVNWRPHLASPDGSLILHICKTGVIGPSIQKRVSAALEADKQVHVLLPPPGPVALDFGSQGFLLTARVSILTTQSSSRDELTVFPDLATAIRNHELLLDPDLAATAIIRYLRESLAVGGSDRGPALERALALGTCQVPGWRVRDINFRNAMEELDILIANSSARSPWNGSAYILVESKNWNSNVGRSEYDSFHMKVKERGGHCRLGLFIASTGFSSAFYERAEHHGAEGFSIVPIVIPRLLEAIESGKSIEEALAQRVERVVLDRVWDE